MKSGFAMLPNLDLEHANSMTEQALLQLEALIFASESPISLSLLKQGLDSAFACSSEPTISGTQLKQWLNLLAARQNDRAIELVETAQGYRFQVREQYSAVIGTLWPERPLKLSPALLETLAVIAYHQPVTRADIEHIRGISLNSQILRTLFDRQWITESGCREVAGRPALLVTTKQFLNAFGLVSLKALPPLEDVKDVLTAFDNISSLQQIDAPA